MPETLRPSLSQKLRLWLLTRDQVAVKMGERFCPDVVRYYDRRPMTQNEIWKADHPKSATRQRTRIEPVREAEEREKQRTAHAPDRDDR